MPKTRHKTVEEKAGSQSSQRVLAMPMLLAILSLTPRAASGGSAPPSAFGFAATLGDEMVLQASPSRAIVWGPLGDDATAVTVSWKPQQQEQQEQPGEQQPGEQQPAEEQPEPPAAVKAETLVWLGLKIWTAKLPAIDASFTPHTITASPDVGADMTAANVTFGEVWVRGCGCCGCCCGSGGGDATACVQTQ
jgi:hypothetical protein